MAAVVASDLIVGWRTSSQSTSNATASAIKAAAALGNHFGRIASCTMDPSMLTGGASRGWMMVWKRCVFGAPVRNRLRGFA